MRVNYEWKLLQEFISGNYYRNLSVEIITGNYQLVYYQLCCAKVCEL